VGRRRTSRRRTGSTIGGGQISDGEAVAQEELGKLHDGNEVAHVEASVQHHRWGAKFCVCGVATAAKEPRRCVTHAMDSEGRN
jgi:hypothetical protein